MKHVNNTKLLTCFLLSTLLSGCAHNTSIPYESFERIEIKALDSEALTDTGPSRSESAATGAATGVADARISLDVNSLQLVKVHGKKVELSLTVATEYEWGLNKPGSQHATLSFRCNTRSWPFDEWVNDNDVTVEQELNYCIEDLAGQITRVLTKPPPMPVDGFPELDV